MREILHPATELTRGHYDGTTSSETAFPTISPEQTTISADTSSALEHVQQTVETSILSPEAPIVLPTKKWSTTPEDLARKLADGSVISQRYRFVGSTALKPGLAERAATYLDDHAAASTFPNEDGETAIDREVATTVENGFTKLAERLKISTVDQPIAVHHFSDEKAFRDALSSGMPSGFRGSAFFSILSGILQLRHPDSLNKHDKPAYRKYFDAHTNQVAHEISHAKSLQICEIIIPEEGLPIINRLGCIGYARPDVTPSPYSIGLNESAANLAALDALREGGYTGELFTSHDGNDVLLDAVITEAAHIQGKDVWDVHNDVVAGLYTGDISGITQLAKALGPERWQTFSALDSLDFEGGAYMARHLQLKGAAERAEAMQAHGDFRIFEWLH